MNRFIYPFNIEINILKVKRWCLRTAQKDSDRTLKLKSKDKKSKQSIAFKSR